MDPAECSSSSAERRVLCVQFTTRYICAPVWTLNVSVCGSLVYICVCITVFPYQAVCVCVSITLSMNMHSAAGHGGRDVPGDVVRTGLCFMEHTVLSCAAAVKRL